MDKISTDFIQDKNMKDTVEHVFENGLGNPIELSAAPTTTGAELKPFQIGWYSTYLYINLGGTIYRLTMVAV